MKVEKYSFYDKLIEGYVSDSEFQDIKSIIDKAKYIDISENYHIYFFDKKYINKTYLYGKIIKKENLNSNITNQLKSNGKELDNIDISHSAYFLIKSSQNIIMLYNSEIKNIISKFNKFLHNINMKNIKLACVIDESSLKEIDIKKGKFKISCMRNIKDDDVTENLRNLNLDTNGYVDSFTFNFNLKKGSSLSNIFNIFKNIFPNGKKLEKCLTYSDGENDFFVDFTKDTVIKKCNIDIDLEEITEEELYNKLEETTI
ncbi:hypothetical protein [Peptostreptococcus russellii]|uniref:hypothetical protein n=1 Tax=Peptostreptococcus russellii TaxID=215200 RepID=UPI003F586EFE